MPSKHKIAPMLSIIFAGEAIFILPFVLARIFRPSLLKALEVSNLELGTSFSIYGMVATVSYFFGGPLADKYAARKLMSLALILTALGGVFMILFPSALALYVVYGFWGFTTIFLFWSPMIKSTRIWGGDGFQGRAFGFLEGGRGLTSALIGLIGLYVFSLAMSGAEISDAQRLQAYSNVMWVAIFTCVISAVLVWIYLRGDEKIEDVGAEQDLIRIRDLVTDKKVLLQAVIILCAYVGYKTTDDYSLYANEVLGFTEVQSAGLGTTAIWLRPVFAVLAGLLADQFGASRVIQICFSIMVLGALVISFGFGSAMLIWMMAVLLFTLLGVYGLRGIYFAVMKDAGIKSVATGTAVGIMSVVGYTPDIFMSPWMGYLLDTYRGELGHQYVFATVLLFAIIGLVASWQLERKVKRSA